ncbi:hypothetical protein EWO27_07500 [Salmonella enterica]|nr:hypothetical protein [Salmonella enterica]
MMLSPSAACATATCSVCRKKTNAPAPCRGRFACPAYARTSSFVGRISAAPSGISTPHVHKHFLFGTM